MHVPSSSHRKNRDPRTGFENIAGTLSCTSVDDRKDPPISVRGERGDGKGMSDDGRGTLRNDAREMPQSRRSLLTHRRSTRSQGRTLGPGT